MHVGIVGRTKNSNHSNDFIAKALTNQGLFLAVRDWLEQSPYIWHGLVKETWEEAKKV